MTGVVKWFDRDGRKYGFITPDPEQELRDVFVHLDAVKKSGLRTLEKGQRVSFDTYENGENRIAAKNLVTVREKILDAVFTPLRKDD